MVDEPYDHDLQLRIFEELQRDALIEQDRAYNEGVQQGRIQGCIVMALFVIAGAAIASLWTI
jgi:hypothetical protein